jgi:hypothetical protein
LSIFAAFVAAIMLVIGGTPVRAATGPCDPCPPDCPMMAQASADQPHKAPKGDPAESPCQAMVACPAAMTLPPGPPPMAIAWLTLKDAGLRPAEEQRAPSRPPDRELRPPIQL